MGSPSSGDSGKVLPDAPAYDYEVIPGFFRHSKDMSKEEAKTYDPMTPFLGLEDDAPAGWKTLTEKLRHWNETAEENTRFMLLYSIRHGQAYHNLAVRKYGLDRYRDEMGSLQGDDEMTWGPDATLTDEGRQQAERTGEVLESAYAEGAPRPQTCKVSPLSRAMDTAHAIVRSSSNMSVEVRENLRERMGVFTAESRSSKSAIQDRIRAYTEQSGACSVAWTIEESMPEVDSWEKTEREAEEDIPKRMRSELDHLATTCPDSVAMLVYHGYMLSATFKTIGHPYLYVKEGYIVPMVVKMSVREDNRLLRSLSSENASTALEGTSADTKV